MDDELKPYCDRLQAEAKIAETCLARVGQHLVSPESTPLANWKTLLQEAATRAGQSVNRPSKLASGSRFGWRK